MSIEFGVGVSALADVSAAGRDAASQAMSAVKGRRPALVIVFSSIRFADPRFLKAVRQSTQNAPLIGCTDSGGISSVGPARRGVTIIVMAGDAFEVTVDVGRNFLGCEAETGRQLAQTLTRRLTKRAKAMLLFPDGLGSNGSDLVAGVQSILGSKIPVVGGAAADDFYFQKTFQYFNDEILCHSVPGAILAGELVVGIGTRHGWVPLGRSRTVTRAEGNVVYELDGLPAVSIYEDYLGMEREELTQGPLAPIAMSYPLGSKKPNDPDFILRGAMDVGSDGSLICTAEIKEGRSVRLMIGGYESALEAAQEAAHEAIRPVGPKNLSGAFVFCSVARQKMLGSEFHGEMDVIRDALGGSHVRMGGFYSYGELAPSVTPGDVSVGTQNVFHNQSVVVMAVGNP